jgi:hypothetical protein
LLYALAFPLQFGAPIKAAYNVDSWRIFKQHISQTAPSPKIVLIGGSSMLFGMDSEYLEQRVGIPVVNHGLHGALPLDWLMEVSLKYVKKGDLVVMGLEWPYYLRDYTRTDPWVADQVIAWNASYFWEMNLARKLEFISSISLPTMLRNLWARIRSAALLRRFPYRRTYSEAEVLESYERESGFQTVFSYSHLNMNRRGDMLRACGNVEGGFRDSGYAIGLYSELTKTSVDFLLQTVKEVEARGARVFLIAPPMIINHTTDAGWFQHRVTYFHEELRHMGFNVLGGPLDYRFPAAAFYNTEYHLECGYARQRTAILAKQLLSVYAWTPNYN